MEDKANHLTRKAIKAGSWLFIYRFIARAANFLKTPILARLLTPSQFGIFGIASISLNLFETFSEIGLEQALIHKKSYNHSMLYAAWVLTLIKSLVISLVIFLTAPLLSQFFNQPETSAMIQVLAIIPILRSLRNPIIVDYKKKVEFSRETVMLIIGSLTEVIIALVLAFIYQSPWALIGSIISGGLVELLVSYLIFPVPKIKSPDWKQVPELLRFGRWVWGSSIISFISNQGDDVLIGKLVGSSGLGLYQNAYKIASLPATQIGGTITQVVFPAFAAIQTQPQRLKRGFYKSLGLTVGVTFPALIIVIIFANPLVKIIFGTDWLGMVPALRILCLYGIVRAVATVYGPLLTASGKPEVLTQYGLLKLMVMVPIIYPATLNYGIVGSAWVMLMSMSFGTGYLIYRVKQLKLLS